MKLADKDELPQTATCLICFGATLTMTFQTSIDKKLSGVLITFAARHLACGGAAVLADGYQTVFRLWRQTLVLSLLILRA